MRDLCATLPDVDPACCPLCGGANACALVAGCSGPCWCVAERFPLGLLARVPPLARDRACLCPGCVAAAQVQPS